jgi:hypothetical protein
MEFEFLFQVPLGVVIGRVSMQVSLNLIFVSKRSLAEAQNGGSCLIPDTPEAEFRRIEILGQPWQKVSETPISTQQ